MRLLFADDSRQNNPTRKGMGPLIAIGGISVPCKATPKVEIEMNEICRKYGFPKGKMFKWSPGRDLWMHDNLIGVRRKAFFLEIVQCLRNYEARAIIIMEDVNYRPALADKSPENDTTCLYIERINLYLKRMGDFGIVILDRPGGDRADENKFLANCLDSLQNGTNYVKPDRIAINFLSTASRFIRLLQAADLVVSCTTAYISGERVFSPPVFAEIKSLFDKGGGQTIGGKGLKIHPDMIYLNLYHWLLGDEEYVKNWSGLSLPRKGFPYFNNSEDPTVVDEGT